MSEEDKLDNPKDDIPITEGMRDILEGNWEKIDEEKERKAANKTMNSLAVILICFLLVCTISAFNINFEVSSILYIVLGITAIFHIIRFISLWPAPKWSRHWPF